MTGTEMDRNLTQDVKDAAILIVDDNTSNVQLLREILHHDGYRRIRGETDPRVVPDLLEAERYDLLLIDIRMPHMSGFELMERVKAIYAGDYVPVLVLTAQTDQETRRRSLELGANDFLTKPFVAWELLQRVRNMLEIRTLYRHVAQQNRELEHRVAERTAALTQALEAVRQADRAKLDFLSVMSHELRTPLNSIIGFAEVMASQSLAPLGHPDYREYVALIEESGKVLLTMVNNILEYTRGATGTIELAESEVQLPALLTTCTGLMLPKAQPKAITVAVEECAPLIVRADLRRLREMLLSLLDNAIKFSGHGCHVSVRADADPHGVTIRVRDDGPGIPPDLIDRLFKPFTLGERTLVRQHEGIGLGLPIVRRFAELHGGTVDLCSTPGMGTAVTIRLPSDRLLSRTP